MRVVRLYRLRVQVGEFRGTIPQPTPCKVKVYCRGKDFHKISLTGWGGTRISPISTYLVELSSATLHRESGGKEVRAGLPVAHPLSLLLLLF
jgi:hypothetical protein